MSDKKNSSDKKNFLDKFLSNLWEVLPIKKLIGVVIGEVILPLMKKYVEDDNEQDWKDDLYLAAEKLYLFFFESVEESEKIEVKKAE
jgi:hypothetical protein